MAISGLRSGLESLGHTVERWSPRTLDPAGARASSDPAGRLVRRIAFNLRLRRGFPEDRYDLVVGFDLDGFALHPADRAAPGRPRRVACLKGVAADELRFESGSVRARMALLSRLERRAARRADRVVVPSRYSLERSADLYGIEPGRCRIVPEGLDLEEWEAEGRGPSEGGSPTVLSVARQYRRKDTASLLRAMPAVLSRHPDARLRVVGGGPELPALRRLRSELGIGASVELPGELATRREVLREYAGADLFCLPSLQEGFGIAYLEAMAAGLPVVACRSGAAPEVVEDGATGLLVRPRRPLDLARAISSLLADRERGEEMGRAGRRRARRHAWSRVARIFLTRATAREAGDGV